jgi:DNA-binding CsgD family transcriptional regulator
MHLVNTRKKLGAQTREQAIAQAVKRGLIDP